MVVANLLPRGCLRGAELACIINIAPGISLALAALELSSKSIVAGTSRLVSALAVSFLIGLGLAFGEELAGFFDFGVATAEPVAKCVPVSLWFLFLLFPVVTFSNMIMLDAPVRRWVVLFLSSAVAFWASFGLTYTRLSSGVQTVLASACVGLLASLYGWLSDYPSSSLVFMGIVFLVPGALSIATFQSAFTPASGAGGLGFGLDFLAISVSVALGLLISSVPKLRRVSPFEEHSQYAGANSLI